MNAADTAEVSRRQGRQTHEIDALGLVMSEWTKFWSVRSTWWCIGVLAFVQISLSAFATFAIASAPTEFGQIGTSSADVTASAITFVTVGAHYDIFTVAILGVLFMTGEYGSGQIRSTLLAVPQRVPVVLAKALVLAVVLFGVSFVSFLISFAAVALTLSLQSLHTSFVDMQVVFSFLGASTYLALIGLMALGFGALVRSSVGGITCSLAVLLGLPAVLAFFQDGWATKVSDLLPTSGAGIFGQAGTNPGQAAAVIVGWATFAIFAGSLRLKKQDA